MGLGLLGGVLLVIGLVCVVLWRKKAPKKKQPRMLLTYKECFDRARLPSFETAVLIAGSLARAMGLGRVLGPMVSVDMGTTRSQCMPRLAAVGQGRQRHGQCRRGVATRAAPRQPPSR